MTSEAPGESSASLAHSHTFAALLTGRANLVGGGGGEGSAWADGVEEEGGVEERMGGWVPAG